jgi:hypothetical protein
MTATELATCHVLEVCAFLVPVEGYMVAFAVFYEQGSSVPSHRFLYLLL